MVGQLKKHWTSRSIDDFVFSIASDFMMQIGKLMHAEGTKQTEVAQRLNVSEGRVSQVLNTPGNMTFRKAAEYARAFGQKVAIVVYDDKDHTNEQGPISGEIFGTCWERAGRPSDFFELRHSVQTPRTLWLYAGVPHEPKVIVTMQFDDSFAATLNHQFNPYGLAGIATAASGSQLAPPGMPMLGYRK